MTIKQRMYLLMAAAIIGLVALTSMSFIQIGRVFSAANFTTVNVVPSLIALDEASIAFDDMQLKMWQFMGASDSAQKAQLLSEMTELHSKTAQKISSYEKGLVADTKDGGLIAEDRNATEAYEVIREKAISMVGDGKADDARAFMLSNKTVGAKVRSDFREHKDYNLVLAKQAESTAHSILSQSQIQSTLIALAVIAGVGIMGIAITRRLINSLEEAVNISQTVASGDLTAQINVSSNDEFGQLLRALKEMNDSLVKIVGEVRVGTDTISTASAEIASGNMELSSRTESQASSLEETAASMEELTSTVKHNSDNAQMANKLAQTASTVAVRGGEEVSKVVQTMGTINESAKKIVDIIGVIDGIAFQTNILALNAAVEAARAGEQGRGFAVVASEVRNLAQRSAAAAKEIKELINTSVENVEAGSKLVNQAGVTMTEVVNSIRQVSDVVTEITAASSEQSQGINQVNQAVIEMDNVTQQNAALVEEAAAAARAMQDQARNLTEVVRVFKLDESAAQRTPAHKPAIKSAPRGMPVARPTNPPKIAAKRAPQKSLERAKPSATNSDTDGFEEF